MPPPITVRTDTEQSPFHGQECSRPLPSLLPSWQPSLWETVARWAQNMTKGARTISAEGCSHRPWWSPMNHFHSEQRGPLWGPRWACPSDSDSSLLDSIGHTHGQRGLLWTLAFLWTPHSWVAVLFSLDESVSLMTRQERCVLSQGAFSFSVLGCACRATLFLLPIHSGPSRTFLTEVGVPVFAVLNV